MHENNVAVVATKDWVEQVIIGFNFCPFAKREFDSGRIRYTPVAGTKRKAFAQTMLDEFYFLQDHPEVETTLVIFEQGLKDFFDYLDFLYFSEELLAEAGLEGVFQLASFHPEYQFEGEDFDDASNYTNRSPYPTIHLIREDSLEQAIAKHPDTAAIPERNQKVAREKGSDYWRAILEKLSQ